MPQATIEQQTRDLDALVVAHIGEIPVTRGELSAAFDLVANPAHWKLAIDAVVQVWGGHDEEVIAAAVEYFTGSRATIEHLSDRVIRVTAAGYFAAIGA